MAARYITEQLAGRRRNRVCPIHLYFAGGLLSLDRDPFWSINCQKHLAIINIDGRHRDITIDDEVFVSSLEEDSHRLQPPHCQRIPRKDLCIVS